MPIQKYYIFLEGFSIWRFVRPPRGAQSCSNHILSHQAEDIRLNSRKPTKGKNAIQQILNNNKYDTSGWDKVNKGKSRKQEDQKEKKRWAKFTYVSKETRLITN
jgi:hypothetical protein